MAFIVFFTMAALFPPRAATAASVTSHARNAAACEHNAKVCVSPRGIARRRMVQQQRMLQATAQLQFDRAMAQIMHAPSARTCSCLMLRKTLCLCRAARSLVLLSAVLVHRSK
jgi:hypothetical protein